MGCKAADAPASHRSAWPLRHKAGCHRPDHWPAPRFQKCHGMGRGPRLVSERCRTPGPETKRSGETAVLLMSLPRPERSLKPWIDPSFSKPPAHTSTEISNLDL